MSFLEFYKDFSGNNEYKGKEVKGVKMDAGK